MKFGDLLLHILIDPDGIEKSGHDLIDSGLPIKYTYPNGEVCHGYEISGTKKTLIRVWRITKIGYFAMAWDNHYIWFIFDDKILRAKNPISQRAHSKVTDYVETKDIPSFYLSMDFIRYYTNKYVS